MSCNNLRSEFVDCVMRSDCVLRKGNTPQSCIKEHASELPEPCQHLRVAFFECKRGMLDMRKRFRGLDPGTIKKKAAEDERVDVR